MITYCANQNCPYSDCKRHLDNAPKTGLVSMAWLDKDCNIYIEWFNGKEVIKR